VIKSILFSVMMSWLSCMKLSWRISFYLLFVDTNQLAIRHPLTFSCVCIIYCFRLQHLCDGRQEHSQQCSLYDLAKMYFTSKFSYLHFSNPTYKLKLRPQIGGRLLITNHLKQSLWLVNQKEGTAVRSYLLHCSLEGVRLCCGFYKPQKTVQ
jgi:hypothetical protein